MANYQINHKTRYQYEQAVAVSHHAARLRPLDDDRQTCHQFHQIISPEPSDLIEREDYFGNTTHQFSIQESHAELLVECDSEVTVYAPEIPIADLTPTCAEVRAYLNAAMNREAINRLEYCYPSRQVPVTEAIAEFARPFFPEDASFLACAGNFAAHIHDAFEFDPTATDATTPVEDVMELRKGVCQDFAHLALSGIRSLGLPARYISGYILTHPPEGQPRLVGADASHAWISIPVPNYGWIDIDPTNRQFCAEEHITVARGRDFADVSLLGGAVTGGGQHTIVIEVTVTPLDKASVARLELPFSGKPDSNTLASS